MDDLQAFGAEFLPGLIGIEFDEPGEGGVLRARLPLRKALFAPNGYVHAGAIVSLADSACGYGCILNLPDGATGFTTIELKTNFLGTALDGTISCESTLVHGGRTTQVWDAIVTNEAGKKLALFRCTQLLLY